MKPMPEGSHFTDIWRTLPSKFPPPNIKYRRSKPFDGAVYRFPMPPEPKSRRKRSS